MTVIALVVCALSLQVGASYPAVPWTITHSNDLTPVSSGARYAWCDLTFDAQKGESLEIGWLADGLVDFYLYAPDGSQVLSVDMCSTYNLTWDVGTTGAHRASWCNPTTRSDVHILYNVTLKRGGGGDGGPREGARWTLPEVHIDPSRIVDSLPYVAVGLISVLIGLVGVVVASHRARHPRREALGRESCSGYASAYCPHPPEVVIAPDGTCVTSTSGYQQGPHG